MSRACTSVGSKLIGLVAGKVCIKHKVNRLADDHAISLLAYNSQRHFNLRKSSVFSHVANVEAACLHLGNGQPIAGKSAKKTSCGKSRKG
jgi:hypothetical protein